MKQITIAGRVGRDAELRRTQDGAPVLSFSVAVSGRRKDDAATWFNCSLFGKRGEALEPHIRKGDNIAVTGDLQVGIYKEKPDIKVNVSEVTLLGSSDRSRNEDAPANHSGFDNPQAQYAPGELNDEIPF